MGKKSGPSAPAAPDPAATAQAQAQYNQQAAITQADLNRINQYTPQGSITYQQTGTTANGNPQYSQTMTYSPEQQALYDQQNGIAQALGGLAQNNIGRVADTQAQNFNFDGMTPMVGSVPGAGDVSQFNGSMPGVNRNVNAPNTQYTFDSGGNIVRGFGNTADDIQRSVGPNDFSADGRRVADAVYGQATSRLDPQFSQMQDDMTARLANQGIAVGSDAYKRDQGNFDRARTDAYGDANFRAIQAGGAEQSRLFGLDMAQGQFANQASGQIFGQNQGAAQFGNQAQAQQYAQNQGQGQFYNQAQDQTFTQGLGNAELYNNAGQMSLSQQLAALGFNNQAGNQAFNQQLADANLTNQTRQQQIGEATYLRNLPLNDIAALLGTGGGVQQPTFNPFAQVGVAAPDYMGGVWNNYNANMNQYNQAQANRSQMLGSIFGGIGSVGGAIAMSDNRLKENVARVGTLANGLATYAFNYIGDTLRRFGVMAQDALSVVPDAVVTMPNGYMAVDYRKVW